MGNLQSGDLKSKSLKFTSRSKSPGPKQLDKKGIKEHQKQCREERTNNISTSYIQDVAATVPSGSVVCSSEQSVTYNEGAETSVHAANCIPEVNQEPVVEIDSIQLQRCENNTHHSQNNNKTHNENFKTHNYITTDSWRKINETNDKNINVSLDKKDNTERLQISKSKDTEISTSRESSSDSVFTDPLTPDNLPKLNNYQNVDKSNNIKKNNIETIDSKETTAKQTRVRKLSICKTGIISLTPTEEQTNYTSPNIVLYKSEQNISNVNDIEPNIEDMSKLDNSCNNSLDNGNNVIKTSGNNEKSEEQLLEKEMPPSISGFTLTKHKKVNLTSTNVKTDTIAHVRRRPSSVSDGVVNDINTSEADSMKFSVLRKVASFTLEKVDTKHIKPKFIPEKLDFQNHEKFEGYVLVNWLVSALMEEQLDQNLFTSQDLRIVVTFCCTHLLNIGVLKQLPDKDVEIHPIFKPNLIYYWAYAEIPSSIPPTPGRLSNFSWPNGNLTSKNSLNDSNMKTIKSDKIDSNSYKSPHKKINKNDTSMKYTSNENEPISSLFNENKKVIELEQIIIDLKNEVEKYRTLLDIQSLTYNKEDYFGSPLKSSVIKVNTENSIFQSTNKHITKDISTQTELKTIDIKESKDISSISKVSINNTESVEHSCNEIIQSDTQKTTLASILSSVTDELPLKSSIITASFSESANTENIPEIKSLTKAQLDVIKTEEILNDFNTIQDVSSSNIYNLSTLNETDNSSLSTTVPSKSSSEPFTTLEKTLIPPPPPLPLSIIPHVPPPLHSSVNSETLLPPPPPMPSIEPQPSFIRIPPPPPISGLGIPPPPPLSGLGIPPPPPLSGIGIPPPPPLSGIGIPPPPPISGLNGLPPPPLPDNLQKVESSVKHDVSTVCGPPPPPPQMGGPLPFPAPPIDGWNSGKEMLRKVPLNPPVPMKPLYWTRIIVPTTQTEPNIEIDSTEKNNLTPLWASLEEINLCNLSEFTDLFSRQIVTKKIPKKKVEKSSKVQSMKILDSKRSQNVGILSQSLHVEFSEIENSIYNFDTSVINLEALQQIYEVRATDDELKQIETHVTTKPEIPLDKPEQFLYDLSKIPNFADRIFCFMFQIEFDDEISTIGNKLDNIKFICDFLINNIGLKKVLSIILTLGNYMNGGNRTRGQADGFGLEILAKLRDVKSKDSQVTLLHFIVRTYIANSDDPSPAMIPLPIPEPGEIDRASAVNFDDVNNELKKLQCQLSACEKRTAKVISESNENNLQPFKNKMETYLSNAKNQLDIEFESLKECKKQFLELMDFYQFKPKNGNLQECQPQDFFASWSSFCIDFKDIWKKELHVLMMEKLLEMKKKQEVSKTTQKKKVKPGSLKWKVNMMSKELNKSNV